MDILKRVKDKRGYLLPYHELFLCVDPGLLEAYDRFYENLTLRENHLDPKTKELVWLGILMGVLEEAGTIHLKRAREAGITDDDISAIVKLTQIAKGFDVLSFVEKKWGQNLIGIAPLEIYEDLVDSVTAKITLPKSTVELIFIAVYSALRNKTALRLHLRRAKTFDLSDEEIAEAMSYIFIPKGANALIEAAKVFMEVVVKGEDNNKPDQ
ncbi:MAG: carboxymuconolactone decarboxylase family protein [Deltaproteobacteria bacterium]|nr:carboxymuconolactone decarboxylase family protein [Deltaproteobacteria bacterium]MBW2152948.1 carboxymuconolactone decarboxylase family protein [Deltaproteobacteria bacterium]